VLVAEVGEQRGSEVLAVLTMPTSAVFPRPAEPGHHVLGIAHGDEHGRVGEQVLPTVVSETCGWSGRTAAKPTSDSSSLICIETAGERGSTPRGTGKAQVLATEAKPAAAAGTRSSSEWGSIAEEGREKVSVPYF
jgi:hypothetical protein